MVYVANSKQYLRHQAIASIQQDLLLYQVGAQYGERVLNIPNKELFEDALSILIETAMKVATSYNMSLAALATSVIKATAQVLERGDMECQN